MPDIADLRRKLAELTEEINKLERRPTEPPEGSVIKFDTHFGSGVRRFTYVAYNSGGRWYCTGSTGPNGVGWDRLFDWMRQHGCKSFEILVPSGEGVEL